MQCPKCGSESLERPIERSALEIFKCLSCGEEIAVHCLYQIPDEYLIKRDTIRVFCQVRDAKSDAKCFLKLKNILKASENFSLSRLEAQRFSGKKKWDLGIFWDSELEDILVACKKASIEIVFEKVEEG